MSTPTYFLLEIAAGYLVLKIKEWDSLSQSLKQAQQSLTDRDKFKSTVSVERFQLFNDSKEALEACQALAAGRCPQTLLTCLQFLFSKNSDYHLGIIDPTLGKELSKLGYKVFYDKNLVELLRICHIHLEYFQVGLGHSFSRSKLKLDPNRQDKPIQNSIALIENFEKSMNQFAMRVKEWYCWHFPELGKILTDSYLFAQAVCIIRIKENFSEADYPKLLEITKSEEIANEIMAAKDISMGQEISECDMVNIEFFAKEFIKIHDQRKDLLEYLGRKLDVVAPNLKTLLGEVLAAKLISHAGSLSNLAKYPASTIQILGAEKALFRALKTKGNTPKYGLLFQSSFIGRAALKNKGRISRYLANKCSLAARIDSFTSIPSDIFGKKLREQIEARLLFLADGVVTRKNLDVMKEASAEYAKIVKSLTKKRKLEEILEDSNVPVIKKHKEKHKKSKSIDLKKSEKIKKKDKVKDSVKEKIGKKSKIRKVSTKKLKE